MHAPTKIRCLSQAELKEADKVFKGTLPDRWRIYLTDALGLYNCPFTIPTSAISFLSIPGFAGSAFGSLLADTSGPLGALSLYSRGGTILSRGASIVNFGYLVNIGPSRYPNMLASNKTKELLIHELTHVWQGHNGIFSMNYVYNSFFHQCRAEITKDDAYYVPPITDPPPSFYSFNAEQQAEIVEGWYRDGMRRNSEADPVSDRDPRWAYIELDIQRLGN